MISCFFLNILPVLSQPVTAWRPIKALHLSYPNIPAPYFISMVLVGERTMFNLGEIFELCPMKRTKTSVSGRIRLLCLHCVSLSLHMLWSLTCVPPRGCLFPHFLGHCWTHNHHTRHYMAFPVVGSGLQLFFTKVACQTLLGILVGKQFRQR